MSKKKSRVAAAVIIILVLLIVAGFCVYWFLLREDIYSQLNQVVNNASSVVLDISTETDGTTLNSRFVIVNGQSGTTINYRVESLEEIDSSNPDAPSKKVTIGGVTVSNGQVTSQTGEALDDVSFVGMTKLGFTFKKSYFDDVKTENGIFSASIVNVDGFFGNNSVIGNDITLTFNYLSDIAKTLEIKYVSTSGAKVTLTYTLS